MCHGCVYTTGICQLQILLRTSYPTSVLAHHYGIVEEAGINTSQAITETNGSWEILVYVAMERSLVLGELVTERSDLVKETREGSLSK